MVDSPHWERLHLPLVSGDVVKPVKSGGSGEIDTEAVTDPANVTDEPATPAVPEVPVDPSAIPRAVTAIEAGIKRAVFERRGMSDD